VTVRNILRYEAMYDFFVILICDNAGKLRVSSEFNSVDSFIE